MPKIMVLFLLFMGSLGTQVSAQKYVTVSGGGNADGSTWADALDNAGFRTALQNASAGDEFWLADGTYLPDNVRDSSFRIPNGVKIYGGFSATDTLWSQRNWKKNVTILSGDIGNQNVTSDNCYHVLLTFHTDTSTVVDGFTITAGNANGNGNLRNHGGGFLNNGGNSGSASSVTVRNCIFLENSANGDGGGFTDFGALDGYVASMIINCVFEGNSGGNGGGLYAAGYNGGNTGTSYTTAINCVFVKNTCNSLGGGAHAHINGGQLSLINCTFTENSSGGGSGSAYYDYKGNTSIVNCIFHNNTGTDIGKSANNANVEVNNSIVQGGFSVGNNIINENPFFVDSNNYIGNDGYWGTDDDGLHVSEGSAAINNGLNDSVPSYITEDFNNVARIKDGKVEIGAYESDYACNEITISTAYTNICKGSVTTFKAHVVSKGGFTPSYQWYKNGSKTGGNSNTFSTGSLSDGDEIYCEVKNSLACYYPNGPVSNTIIMHVQSASSSTLAGNSCLGSTLTATNTSNASKIKWVSNGNTLYTATRKPIGTATTEAGDASGTSGSDSTKFDLSVSVLVDDNGNTYVADLNNNRIQKWPQGYTYAITIAGDANGTSGVDSNMLTEPTGIALDQAGNLYIADAQNNRVQKWSLGATYGITVAGDKNGASGTDSAHLNSPANIFVDILGNIYVTDNLNHRVQRWAPGATYGVTVAGDPNGTSGTSASLLKEPVGIYVDKDSNVYVSDNGNNRVQKWAPNATSGVTIAGDASGNSGNDSISLDGPGGIYMDIASNLYITDINNHRVMKYMAGETYGVNVAGDLQGASGSSSSKLNNPTGVCVDGAGDVYVADLLNNRIQKWNQQFDDSTYTPNVAGTYTAVVTSPAGCVVTTNSITIYNTLTPTISISASQNSICSGNSITFTASTTGGGTTPTFEWYKNGVSTGVTDSTYTSNNWSNNDTIYCVFNSNYACATVNQLNSNKVGVTVNTTPIATIAAAGNTTFCQGDSLALHATAGSSNYRWMLNGNVVSTSTDSIYYASTSGDYSVEVSNGNCPDTSGSITISVIQGPSVSVNPNTAQTICQGDTVKLTATTNASNTIQWYNASGSINGAITSIYLAKTSGTYYARVSNGTCSANSNSVNVTVNPLPNAQISVSGATTFCQGDSVTLSASTGNGYTYQWFDGANILTNATSDKFVAKTSGSYGVKVTAASCVSSSAGTIITVNPLPTVPTISRAGQVLTSSAATGYQWYNNGTAILGATNQTYTFNAGGKYMVEITDAKGCKNRSLEYNNTGINEALNTIGMTLQPNPTQGKFMINLLGVEKSATVVIYDLTGREITRKLMNHTTEIEMTNEPAGMYIVYVYAGDKVAYAKLEKL